MKINFQCKVCDIIPNNKTYYRMEDFYNHLKSNIHCQNMV
jgi:hypothetical protein